MTALTARLEPEIVRLPHDITCPRKSPYRSREYAHAVALWMEVLHGEDFNEYACGACGAWHVGHVYPRPRKATRTDALEEQQP